MGQRELRVEFGRGKYMECGRRIKNEHRTSEGKGEAVATPSPLSQ
jgi:hypothetical protein